MGSAQKCQQIMTPCPWANNKSVSQIRRPYQTDLTTLFGPANKQPVTCHWRPPGFIFIFYYNFTLPPGKRARKARASGQIIFFVFRQMFSFFIRYFSTYFITFAVPFVSPILSPVYFSRTFTGFSENQTGSNMQIK